MGNALKGEERGFAPYGKLMSIRCAILKEVLMQKRVLDNGVIQMGSQISKI